MNERLKFSWGHIIAFLALIAVSYISFVGCTYLTNGNFLYASICTVLTDILFILFFIGAQQMKASGYKISRKIVWERIFVYGSPLIFVAGMVTMSHFWTVKSQNDEIVEQFTSSINGSRQLFTDYEKYCNARIDTYRKNLNRSIAQVDSVGAVSYSLIDSIQRDNKLEVLRLQLLSQNYDSLKMVANKWIDESSQGASTWNVFLLGNTREIKSALAKWEEQLQDYAEKEMYDESFYGPVAQFQSDGAQDAIDGIDGLTSAFTTQQLPNPSAIIFGVVIYLMLIFPYLIQERHTKSVYRLWGREKDPSKKTQKRKEKERKASKNGPVNENNLPIAPTSTTNQSTDSNDYPTF